MTERRASYHASEPIVFIVEGEPLPKQSYRAVKGGGYTDPRIKAWQQTVSAAALAAMQGREPITGAVSVRLVFARSTRRTVDLDNLSKGVLDGIKNICFGDDCQVVNLHLVKHVRQYPGVIIAIYPGDLLPGWVETWEGEP